MFLLHGLLFLSLFLALEFVWVTAQPSKVEWYLPKSLYCNVTFFRYVWFFIFYHFSAVSDLTLGLVSCQSEDTLYSSKTVICGNVNHHRKQPENSNLSHSQTSPSLKRIRLGNAKTALNVKQLLPGNQTRLTAVSSIPRFTCVDNCSMSVVVTWTSYTSDGSLDRHSMHCGYITLFTEQIMDGRLRINSNLDPRSIQQDIEALKSVSIETEVIKCSTISLFYLFIISCSLHFGPSGPYLQLEVWFPGPYNWLAIKIFKILTLRCLNLLVDMAQ